MFRETTSCHLTTMTMVKRDDEVLVLERVKDWKGITFPGGHVEKGESITESALREIKEETGLTLLDIKLKGIIDWYNTENGERFFVYCYIAENFEGNLLTKTDEGNIKFVKLKDLTNLELCVGFKEQLPIFLDNYSEYFGTYGDGTDKPKILL